MNCCAVRIADAFLFEYIFFFYYLKRFCLDIKLSLYIHLASLCIHFSMRIQAKIWYIVKTFPFLKRLNKGVSIEFIYPSINVSPRLSTRIDIIAETLQIVHSEQISSR